MEINILNETTKEFDFPYEEAINTVVNGALDFVNCPFECTVDITIVDDDTIKEINNEQRQINKSTDVLSFPMIEYNKPGEFEFLEEDSYNDCFDPESGNLLLGDIIISIDHVKEQAISYGHSEYRELAFLVAHSMFHLFGYDHMVEDECKVMETLQKDLLNKLQITRDADFYSKIKNAHEIVDNATLIMKAKEAMNYSYSPYSHFKVGAALSTKHGQVFTGCNIENASYGATICAERTAATKAISEGYVDFDKIAIVSTREEFTYPCGICRQFLSEFSKDLIIVLSNKEGEIKEVRLSELMPEAFSL